MNEQERYVFGFTDTAENGAGFCAAREAGFARVSPMTASARAWLREHVNEEEETSWIDHDLIVEMRYFPVLADAIMAAGFAFERNALPN